MKVRKILSIFKSDKGEKVTQKRAKFHFQTCWSLIACGKGNGSELAIPISSRHRLATDVRCRQSGVQTKENKIFIGIFASFV